MNERITRGENWPLASWRLTTMREKTTPTVVIIAPATVATSQVAALLLIARASGTSASSPTRSSTAVAAIASMTPPNIAGNRGISHFSRLFLVSLSLALRSASTSSSFVMSERPGMSSFWACS